MANDRTVPTSKSSDLPTYTINVDGNALGNNYDVEAIEVKKEVNRIPWAKIVLHDGSASEESFEASDDKQFLPGSEIEINAGYHSDEKIIFKGILVKHCIKVRKGKPDFLVLECRDQAIKMTLNRKSRYFYESTDAEMIETVLEDYGLDTDIESTKQEHAEFIQKDALDWDFVMARIKASGSLSSVDDGKFTTQKPDFKDESVATLQYGATILEFEAEMDATHQPKSVSSSAWDYVNQELLSVEAIEPSIDTGGDVKAEDLSKALEDPEIDLRHGGSIKEAELQAWADGELLRARLCKIQGMVKFIGIPDVKPFTYLNLQGVGKHFSGKVFIRCVHHVIKDGSWVVEAKFGLEKDWFGPGLLQVNSPAANSLLPAIQGLHIAVVTQLEEDPEGEDRIMIRIPSIDFDQEGIWARISTLDAGENRGSFFRPEVDDEVIVGFLNGDPREPVVLGMLNSSAKPAPITAADDNHEKGFITRSELKILFNDDTNTLTIETPAGKKVLLDEDSGDLAIEDDNGNSVVLNADGIVIESAKDLTLKASGDINIEGQNISNNAQMNFKAEGSAGAEVSTSATAVLKGSMVQIN